MYRRVSLIHAPAKTLDRGHDHTWCELGLGVPEDTHDLAQDLGQGFTILV